MSAPLVVPETLELSMKPEPAEANGGAATSRTPSSQLTRQLKLEIATGYPVLWSRPTVFDGCQRGVRVDMAGAATIAELAGRISSIGILMLFVRSRFVIACVTAGAVRLESGKLPVDGFRIALMTSGTQEVATVILRFIRQARMAVIGWPPGNRVVAQAAIQQRIEMSRVLAGRSCAVMT